MSEAQQPVFSIEKLYVKDLSLEIPNAPQIFLDRDPPQIELQLNTDESTIDGNGGVYETVIRVTVTARLKDKTMFLVEASQAGIFQIRNVGEKELEQILGIACPNILFPYVREVVSETVVRAGFAPVMLNPMNFEAFYRQKQQARQQAVSNGNGAGQPAVNEPTQLA